MLRKLLLAAALMVLPSLAHADWYEASSKHFVVYSDDSPERVKRFAERMERFDKALRTVTGVPDRPVSPSSRVSVFVVKDIGAIERLIGRQGVGGFYIPRASGPVAFVPQRANGMIDSQEILMHEYGHAFMWQAWPDIVFPKWFTEGFAEFVGTAAFRDDGSVILGGIPDVRTWSVGRAQDLPATELLKLKMGELDRYQISALYARGWLLTHYLLLDKDRAKLLADYIGALNAGKSSAEANAVFGDLNSLDTKLTNYAKRKALPSIQLPADRLKIEDVTVRRLGAGEAAVMPARILSSRGVDEKSAPEVVALARRLAGPFANDAAAQNELAEAEFDAKNFAAAEAAADRALAADPKSVRAMIYKGMAQSELAKKDDGADAGRWKAIRGLFVRANKAETEYPWPLQLFHDSFRDAKEKPPASADNALIYAYQLAPFDLELRLKAGMLFLRQDKIKAARVAFEPVAYGPHSGAEGKTALAVIEALDSKGSEAALKVLSDAEAKQKEDAAKKKKDG